MLVSNRIILLPMFFFQSRVHHTSAPPAKSDYYIPTFLKIHISPSFCRSGLRYLSYPTNTLNQVHWSWLTPPHPCFSNVYNQLYTSLSVSLHLASAYILYSVVHAFETISICLNVKCNQDEKALHNIRENSRSASTKRRFILKKSNHNEIRKPVR